ncbi:MAG: AAA family ATPase [Alphaproteobacteria bacterium]|nr:AAA family ATPase [Alphaproteobacteria bacterium]
MYEDFYKLSGRPFLISPDYRFYFDARPHKKALAYLTYAIDQGEGFVVITGDIGTGKTTLIDYILSTFVGRNLVAAKVVSTQLDADNMLRAVAEKFNVSQEGADKATVLKRIENFLADNHRMAKPVILFIDEAQNLSRAALEELRMLSNFQLGNRPLLQTYLVGQPEFRNTLASKDMEQLRQRVITSCHLGPLDAEETQAYIEYRLKRVEWLDDPIFTEEAFQLIYEVSGGVPRRINIFCDRLLLTGFIERTHEIDADLIHEVLSGMSEEGLVPAIAS